MDGQNPNKIVRNRNIISSTGGWNPGQECRKKTILAEQASCKGLRDKQSWTSTRLTTMKNRSKKKDTKLEGVRRAVAKKEVEGEVAKNQAIQHENSRRTY